jgi:hypothetical protein
MALRRNAHKISAGKLEDKRRRERSRFEFDDNININFKGIDCIILG